MASQLELRARAALCKQLAKREPTNRVLWMAEAENWSRLSNEKLRGEAERKTGYRILANLGVTIYINIVPAVSSSATKMHRR